MALMNFPHWVSTEYVSTQVHTQRHNAQQTNTDADSQYSTQHTAHYYTHSGLVPPDSVYKELCSPLRLYAEHGTFPAPRPCL